MFPGSLPAALQHALSFVGHTRVDTTRIPWSRFPLVGRTLVSPLTSSDIGRVESLVINLAGTPGADRKAFIWPKKAFFTAISKHNGALVPLGRYTSPSRPRHASSTAIVASLCHYYILLFFWLQ